ncbi:hypothetical protein K353_05720 [Kitasatospora sp. SolWspMP-SS2h]|uniref:hypothetical protein n=1 Tax=Kitasatospora sp. SolWspMP-SS2h TaxID=1305729 RepID=UPI000DB94131|nr:hypothetical protein [Kitasatospora sp. SolWspMP-SS2h]RAJ33201.1 hypothetical protein K353_05720 [Kitasatospora sp. SolWspMP-SS2h]
MTDLRLVPALPAPAPASTADRNGSGGADLRRPPRGPAPGALPDGTGGTGGTDEDRQAPGRAHRAVGAGHCRFAASYED